MIRVVLRTGGEFRPAMKQGHIDFLRIPVNDSKDFVVSPPGIVSFEDAQKIAGDLRDHKPEGRIKGYEWRKQ